MLRKLFAQLWKDESGSVIATEYLMLGSIVALGSASGMGAMRDAMVDEYKEYGQSVRELRQSYSTPTLKGGNATVGGTNVVNSGPSQMQAPTNPNGKNMHSIFSCP